MEEPNNQDKCLWRQGVHLPLNMVHRPTHRVAMSPFCIQHQTVSSVDKLQVLEELLIQLPGLTGQVKEK